MAPALGAEYARAPLYGQPDTTRLALITRRQEKRGRLAEAAPSCTPRSQGAETHLRSLEFFDFLREFGHGLEQVGYEAIVGNLKNWRLLVLVDGHDNLRILHSR